MTGIRTTASFLLVITCTTAWLQAQPTRDGALPPKGTAAISGVVVIDGRDARPARRARVMLNNAERTVGRTVVTEEDGTFSLTGLPAGRYQISAYKEGFLTSSFGARRPGRPGTPIVVESNQQVTGISLRMTRGSVITGTLTDEEGQPLPNTMVRAYRASFLGGQRRFAPSGSGLQTTDDRGVFRIHSLAPGDYVVAASFDQARTQPTDLRRVTVDEVRRAMTEVQRTASGGRVRPGSGGSDVQPALQADKDAGSVGYAPVFYPGTTVLAEAGQIPLGVAEERGGIDFALQTVPTARVHGTVSLPDGVPPAVQVQMVSVAGAGNTPGLAFGLDGFRSTRADAQGKFSFPPMPPGTYAILARGGTPTRPSAPAGGSAAAAGTPLLWAQVDVVLDGQDIVDIALTLLPGMTVSGRVQFDGTSAPPDLTRVRVNLSPVQSGNEATLGVQPVAVDATGRFAFNGVTPGRYRLMATIPGARPDQGWTPRSAVVNGVDTLDTPFDLKPMQHVADAVITFTDRLTEISGLVQDEAGRPAPDYFIVAFASDSHHWTPPSRRVTSVRPSADGRYSVRNLPPGDYLIAALLDVEPGEWQDPAFLQPLVGASIKVTLAEGEKKTQDLRFSTSR
jgi:protocatechuate 3,4-dioxygenase beta subunit